MCFLGFFRSTWVFFVDGLILYYQLLFRFLRCRSFQELVKGTYRVTFDTETYFRAKGAPCFYPEVAVMFRVEDPSEHFHIPLLLSPFGYSTYRGS